MARAIAVAIEIAGGLGLIVALSFLAFPGHPAFLDVQPHPFWLVVLLVAGRYGSPAGYAAGLAAALIHLGFTLGPAADPTSLAAFLRQAQLAPFVPALLFLLGGGLLAELRQSQRRAYERLEQKHHEVSEALQDLAVKYLTANDAKRELEKRIVGQVATVATLYEAAKRLESLHPEELYPAIVDLVIRFVHAEGAAIYLFQDGKLRLKAGIPTTPDWPRPEVMGVGGQESGDGGQESGAGKGSRVPDAHPLLDLAVYERRVATVRDLVANPQPRQFGEQRLILAAPLIGWQNDVCGVLVVDRIPFLEFTYSAVKLFTMAADWASTAIQQARRFQETKDRNIEDELTGAYNFRYMQKRIDEEVQRALRHGLPLSLIMFRVKRYHDISRPLLPKVKLVLGTVFREGLRTIDLVGHDQEEDRFLVLLPLTPAVGARVVCDRLRREVRAFGFQPYADDQSLELTGWISSFDNEAGKWRIFDQAGNPADGREPVSAERVAR